MADLGSVFEFATAGRIVFGEGERHKAAHLAAEFGERAFVVVGHSGHDSQQLQRDLTVAGIEVSHYEVNGEPTIDVIREATKQARRSECDLVIGFGGGSALDTAKAIGAMLANPGEVSDYLEVVGRGQSLGRPSVPVLAIPTTAGTGSEVTRNAVISSPEYRVKVSMRSASMLPRVALVDPELTYSLPPEVTFSTGLDALTQVIEPFVSILANPLTDSLCRDGIRRASRALPALADNLNDPAGRRDMALASLFGGLALANAKLGAVHGFAGVIGGLIPAPHGAICARLLPPVMAANVRALSSEGQFEKLERFREVAIYLTGDPQARASDGVDWISSLTDRLNIQPLGFYGLQSAQISEVVEKSERSSSMRGNPVQLPSRVLAEILLQAL